MNGWNTNEAGRIAPLAGHDRPVLATILAAAEETPKYGGTLIYMIPADAPPTFDAQREQAYATIHSAAPFYSTLIRNQCKRLAFP